MSDQKKKNSAYNNFLALHNSINKRLDQGITNAQKGIPQDKPSVQSEASKKIATKATGSKAKNAVTFTPARTRQEYDSAIATGKKELSRLAELLSKKQDFGTFLRNTYTMTPAAASAQEAATKDAWAKEYGYGSWKDAQNRYDLLKAETGQMEKELRYGYLSEEPDYKYFSALGASAKNPAMDEVEKWVGGADVANIVTYSRENADQIAMGEANNSRMKGRSIYQFMTDQEVQNYNYILAKEGAESAEGYLEFLEADLQKRQAEPWTESLQGIQNPVGKAVAQGAYGFAAGIDRAMSGYTPDQPTSAIQHTSQELQQDMSDVGRVFYSAAENVGNMAPSVLVSYLLGGIGAPAQLAQAAGNITMGTSVAGNAYKQAIEDGYGETQARNYGTLVGLSETMLQKLLGGISALGGISDTKIMASLSKIDNALLRGAAKLGVNLAGEIAEEELQNYLEPAFRTILFGEDYDAPTIDELVETALVTAITVGAMEGPMTVAETISEEVEETATLRESAPALVAESQELSGDTELGTRIQEQIDTGKKVSGRDLRNLVTQNEQVIATQTATQAEAMLTERGETGNVAEVAQVVGKMATGQRLTRQEMQIFRESQNAADVLNEINEAEATTETPVQETTETAQEEQIPAPVEVEGEAQKIAPAAEIGRESASVPAPAAEVTEPTETDVKAAQGATLYEDEAREIEAYSKQYGEQAEDYIRSFDAGQNVAEYDTAWKAGYALGMSQVPQAQAMDSSDLAYLTPGQRVDAYEAGLKAAGVMAEQKEARVQGMTRNATGTQKRGIVRAYNGINTATLTQKFNDSQRKAYKILSTIADVTGIEIVLYESTPEADGVYREAQGKYIRSQPGRIFVDLNAGISHVSEVGDMANYTMLATFTHEFVHFCENWNPIRYNELRKAVFDAMAENNINVEERIDQLMAESNGELSREDASREAVAEALVEILPDANFVEQLANEHKTLFRKMLERLKEFLQDIKDYFAGMRKSNDPTVAALKEEVDGMTRYMEHIVKLFDNVAVEAVNRMQTSDRNSDVEESGIQKQGRNARSDVDEESTIVNDNPEAHTPEEQAVIEAYKDAVDPELLAFFDEVRNEENKYKARLKTKKISDVTQRAVDDVKRILGVDVSGYSHVIDGSTIAHIEHRHGTNGQGDSSMRDENDMARIGYVLANYDHATIGLEKDGTQRFSEKWRNSDNTKAPTVVFSKKINGTYYVVEAVPNTKRHNMTVITAYINKKGVSSPELNMSKKSDPQPTSETLRAQETPIDSIAKAREEVNTQFQRRPVPADRDAEYMDAVNRGDMETAQRLVDEAAKRAGYHVGPLYHGTSRFGFTVYDMDANTASQGMIYASDRREVAANYGGRNNYAGVRPIGKRLRSGTSLQDVIHNAESVFGRQYKVASDQQRKQTTLSIQNAGQEIASKIDDLYDSVRSLPQFDTVADGDYYQSPAHWWDMICNLVWTVTGDPSINDDGTWSDYDYESLETAVNRFEEFYAKFRDYLTDNYDAIQHTPGMDVYQYVTTHAIFDWYVDVKYVYLPLVKHGETVLTDGKSYVTKDTLEERINNSKDIGAYQLYAAPGDNVLEVDANGRDWLTLSVPEMDSKYHSTDAVAKWAKKEGYTSVLVKNVYDGGMNANEYILFAANQAKSADPVTYDDSGNVILLSARFDTTNPDIRYQRRPSNRLSDLEVLNAAADGLEGLSLTEAEENSLGVMRQKLARLAPISDQIEEHERLAEEYAARDPEEAQKERNRAIVLKTKRTRELNSILAGANGPIMRRVLQKARSIVERQELTEYRASRKESELAKRYKARIEKDVNELIAWGMKPDTKNAMKHIPEGIKGPVMDFLEAIDFSSKRKLAGGEATQKDLRLAAKLQAIKSALDGGSKSVISEDYKNIVLPEAFFGRIESLISEVNNLTSQAQSMDAVINEMSAKGLEDLSDLIKNLKKLITDFNTFHKNAMFAHVYEAGQETTQTLRKMKPMGGANPVGGYLDWSLARPAYVWERFGKGGESIWHELQNAQADQAFHIDEVEKWANKTYSAEEVKAWEKDVRKIELSDGKTVEMTVAQIMAVYKLRERQQALGHLLGEGMRIPKTAGIKQADEGHFLTEADLDTITNELNDRQKAVADKLQKYMQDKGSEWGNQVTMVRFGEKLFGEPNYYPIHVDRTGLSQTLDEPLEAQSLYALLNMGFTKQTKDEAKNRIVIYSIFDEFSTHMASMATYNAFALPVVDAIKWFNYSEGTGQGVRSQLARVYGREKGFGTNEGKSLAEAWILNQIKAINGTNRTQMSVPERLIGKATSTYNRAQIAANLSVVIQQPFSVLRATNVISPVSLAAGEIKKWGQVKSVWAEMDKHSGIALWKKLGFYDVNITRGLSELIKHDKKVTDKIADGSMMLAELMDRWAWATMWQACKREVEAKQKIKPGAEGYWDAVSALFDEVIYKTQVVDSPLAKAEFMTSKSVATRPFTAFMSEPLAAYNNAADAFYKFRMTAAKDGKGKAWNKHKGAILRGIAVYASSALVQAMVTALRDAWRDDDEYATFGEKWEENFRANFWEELNPFSKLPWVSDIVNSVLLVLKENEIIKADVYESSTAAQSLIDLANKLLRQHTKDTKYTDYGKVYNWLKALSGATGIPFANLTREVISIWNNTVGGLYPDKKIQTYDPGDKQSIREALESGYLTEEEAADALQKAKVTDSNGDPISYEGTAAYWAYQANHPDEDIESSWFDKYYDKGAKKAGINLDTYLSYRQKVKGLDSKKDILPIINGMNITKAQKDALYREHTNWSEDALSEAPWH